MFIYTLYNECMYVCMYACTFVCIYVCIHCKAHQDALTLHRRRDGVRHTSPRRIKHRCSAVGPQCLATVAGAAHLHSGSVVALHTNVAVKAQHHAAETSDSDPGRDGSHRTTEGKSE